MTETESLENQIRQTAAIMSQELRAMKLTVIAIPDGRPNSHRGIRCVICQNPDWYSRLCNQFLARRKRRWKRSRTIIKRIHTLTALEQIAIAGVNPRSTYHERLLDAIEWFNETRLQTS